MDLKVFFTVFTTVFFAGALALTVATTIGVIAGSLISGSINQKYLSWAAGFGFIAIGVWTLIRA